MSLLIWLPFTDDITNQGISSLNQTYNSLTKDVSGELGNCYKGYGIIYHTTANYIGNKWTITTWVKSSSWSVNNDIIFCNNVSTASHCKIYFSIINGAYLNIGINTASESFKQSYTFNANEWYHVAVTYDGTSGILYVNGNQIKSGVVNNAEFTDCTNIGIGCRSSNSNGTSEVGGTSTKFLNDFRIYDTALSPHEIKEISKGLVAHYTFSHSNMAKNYFNPVDFVRGSASTANIRTFKDGLLTLHSNITNSFSQIIPSLSDYMTDVIPPGTYTFSVQNWNGTHELSSIRNIALKVKNTNNDTISLPLNTPTTLSTNCTVVEVTGTYSNYVAGSEISCRFMLQDGSIVTPWSPPDGSDLYSAIKLNNRIEYDVSGYQRNISIVSGTPIYSSDTPKYKVSTEFNDMYYTGEPLPSETKSISLWVKVGTINSNSVVFADYGSKIAFGFNGNNTTYIVVCGSSYTVNGRCIAPSNTWKDNNWNHFVIVKTEGNTFTTYLNGKQCTASSTNYWTHTNDNLTIGRRSSGTPYYGYLSDFRAYATELSSDDILELYNSHSSSITDEQ